MLSAGAYDHCQKAIADSPAEAKVTWATIKVAQAGIIQKVVDTKFVTKEGTAEEIVKGEEGAHACTGVGVCGHVGRVKVGCGARMVKRSLW